MKSGTAARAAYAIAAVAVVALAAMPVISLLSDIRGSSLAEGTHSVYDLTKMDEETLAGNISGAVGGSAGYLIEYGNAKEDIDPAAIDALAERILASGEKSATVRDPSGDVAVQKSIAYRNALIFGSRSGVIVPDTYTKFVDMQISPRFHSSDGLVDYAVPSEQTRREGEVSVEYVMPIALYNMIGAYGCSLGLHIEADYRTFAELVLEADTEDVSFEHNLAAEGGKTVLTVMDCAASELGEGSIGSVALEFAGTGGRDMILSCEGKLSDALRSSLSDGKLTMELNGGSHEMTAEESELFMKIVSALEGSA